LINAEANHDRIEDWHPAPEVFYANGPIADVGPYWLTFMTLVLGPVKRVTAYGRILKPKRVTKAGRPFTVKFPDYFVAMLEFGNGAVARFTVNFYVGWRSKQNGIEVHGDKARLSIANWHHRNAEINFGLWGQDYQKAPLVRDAPDDMDWARGLADLEEALRLGRPHRASAEQAAHLVEVIHAIHASAKTGKSVAVKSKFPQPKPMAWAS
jgi:predicted dehydrogenase